MLFKEIRYNSFSLTFVGDVSPFWIRKSILSLSNPLFHARRNGGTSSTVERWKPTQPGECVCGGGELVCIINGQVKAANKQETP